MTPSIAWMGLKTRLGTRAMRRRAFLRMPFAPEYLAQIRTDELALSLAPVIGRDLADWPPIILKQLKALGQHDRTSELNKLMKIPTLVVSAEKDPIALTHYGRLLCLHIDGARYVEIKGASHGVTLQEPGLINNMLTDHFRSSSTQPDSVGHASSTPMPAERSIAWRTGHSAIVAFGGSR